MPNLVEEVKVGNNKYQRCELYFITLPIEIEKIQNVIENFSFEIEIESIWNWHFPFEIKKIRKEIEIFPFENI